MTLVEFKKIIKGKELSVRVQATSFEIKISRKDAVDLYKYADGNLALFGGGNHISIEANGQELYGFTGLESCNNNK